VRIAWVPTRCPHHVPHGEHGDDDEVHAAEEGEKALGGQVGDVVVCTTAAQGKRSRRQESTGHTSSLTNAYTVRTRVVCQGLEIAVAAAREVEAPWDVRLHKGKCK
jgi:hypothetical protein